MNINDLISHTVKSVAKAEDYESKVTDHVLSIDGMSSPKVRHLVNNLCSFGGCSYLEVGSWKGSTLSSALCGNNLGNVTAYENFAEFTDSGHESGKGSIKNQLLSNIDRNKGVNSVNLIEGDFFNSPLPVSTQFDVYLYDGAHTVETQYYQVQKAKDSLSKYSIMLVDDWLCKVSRPRDATLKALNDFGFYIHTFIELPEGFKDGYWGGQGLFVLEKK